MSSYLQISLLHQSETLFCLYLVLNPGSWFNFFFIVYSFPNFGAVFFSSFLKKNGREVNCLRHHKSEKYLFLLTYTWYFGWLKTTSLEIIFSQTSIVLCLCLMFQALNLKAFWIFIHIWNLFFPCGSFKALYS